MLKRHLKPYLYYQKSIDLFETADDKAHITTIYIVKFSSINNALKSFGKQCFVIILLGIPSLM